MVIGLIKSYPKAITGSLPVSNVMEEFLLEGHDYIELTNLLKLLGWCHSGGIAKQFIANGDVLVDGQLETRKKCKIRAGQKVEFNGQHVLIK